jgi:hypothetical protein
MIYSFSVSCKITQIIDESVAISLEDQFNIYIHVLCENPHDKVLRFFLFKKGKTIQYNGKNNIIKTNNTMKKILL